jgi:superfamily II DNA or RNA helicase
MPKQWFKKFDAALCDEVHLGKAASLTTIMENCTEAAWKIGMTGSLDDSKTHKQMLRALYGDITRVATTRALIDRGFSANININCLLLKYSKDTSALIKNATYREEINFLVSHEKRNKFITRLANDLKGNTLILFNLVDKHGKVLHDMIKAYAPEREIYFVSGATDVEQREQVRSLTELGTDVIIIASLGVFSTGVNIKRLHNVIFASPTKSVIRVLQSIGRGLRLAHDKQVFELYDLSDDLAVTRKKKNYTYDHFTERLRIYADEEFSYKITEVEIE